MRVQRYYSADELFGTMIGSMVCLGVTIGVVYYAGVGLMALWNLVF